MLKYTNGSGDANINAQKLNKLKICTCMLCLYRRH